jgi:UDP-N-acetyl-D-mannosaminuronic acid dehydrogenase
MRPSPAGQVHRCSAEVAELTKLAENAFRDTNVAFANELANVCAHLGLDVWEVIRLANRHPRVQILRPGPGVGGHCIAVDPWFIAASAAPHDTPLIQAARQRQRSAAPPACVEQVRAPRGPPAPARRSPASASATSPTSTTSARAPSLHIAKALAAEPDLELSCSSNPTSTRTPIADIPAGQRSRTALAEADIIVILVAHRQFRHLRPDHLLHLMVVDHRRPPEHQDMSEGT